MCCHMTFIQNSCEIQHHLTFMVLTRSCMSSNCGTPLDYKLGTTVCPTKHEHLVVADWHLSQLV